MDTKIGVYVCKGCDIAKSVDVDKLLETAKEKEAAVYKAHDALCAPEGVQMIRDDVEKEGLNRVSVAACSQRVFPELFDFGKDIVTDRANMREQVAWCHTPNDEDTQMLAEDYIRMSVARLRVANPPEPFIEETSKDIMVIGGGVTGMTAAAAASDAGYKVMLVEKQPHLGGWAAKFRKVFPKNPPYRDLENSTCSELIERINQDDNITVHLSSTVDKTDGQPGKFNVTLKGANGTSEFTVGSIVSVRSSRRPAGSPTMPAN